MLKKYRADLDGLRAIAIILVIFFHAKFPGFSGGYIGVDVFFVISGFLITSILFTEYESTGRIDLLNFYSKRFKRLYPALIFVILASVLIYYFVFPFDKNNLSIFTKSVKYSISGLGNLFFFRKLGGYFDAAAEEMPLLHFWSLAVEEQFYVIWPLIILISKFVFTGHFNRKTPLKKRISILLLLIFIVSFMITEHWVQLGEVKKAFYMMPSRAWELAIGGLIALNYEYIRSKVLLLSTTYVSAIGTIAFLIILLPAYFFDHMTVFPGINALPPVIGTALLIAIGERSFFISRFLSSKPFIKIGILSYGWYLWHWPLLSFTHKFYVEYPPTLLVNSCAVIVSLVMAQVSLSLIEAPIRYGVFFQKFSPIKTIITTIVISILIVIGSYQLNTYNQNYYEPIQGRAIYKQMNKRTNWKLDCINDESCLVLKSNPSKTIYMWGDSHAWSYSPILNRFQNNNHINMHSLTQTSLMPLFELEGYYPGNQPFHSYRNANKKVLEILNEDRLSKRLILSARWSAYLGNAPISITDKLSSISNELNYKKDLKKFEYLIEDTIKKLNKANVEKTLIILQFPEFRSDINKCLLKELGCSTSTDEMQKYSINVNEIIYRVTKNKTNVRVIDPTPYFCKNNKCAQIIKKDGKYYPITYDDDHPSVWAANYLGEKIKDDLNWLVE